MNLKDDDRRATPRFGQASVMAPPLTPPARRPSLGMRLPDWLLGRPGSQRLRAGQSLLAAVVYLAGALVQRFEVSQGLMDSHASNVVSGLSLIGSVALFLVIRSGLSRRFVSDPSLTFVQCLFGILIICMAYAISGPTRGAVMGIVLVVLVFGMFALPPRRIRFLAFFAFGLLTALMAWRTHTDPVGYPAAVEATHLMLTLVVFTAIAALSLRLSAMRDRLQRQKAELSRALEQNIRLATLDDLTGLVNRRHMTDCLRDAQERQRDGSPSMSLAVIDIDHFKTVNDRFGHAVGDIVLRGFAALAMSEMRACDVLSRWGGEEFLVLMPETDTDTAQHAIDRLREAFGRLDWPEIDATLRVTLSAGIATGMAGERIDRVIERADRAMYEAKAAGRDRVGSSVDEGKATPHGLAKGHRSLEPCKDARV